VSTVAEIEAVLPKLSREDLARIEAVLHRLQRDREMDFRFDGRQWPATPQQTEAEIAETDALPPLLSPEEAARFGVWLQTERERQRELAKRADEKISRLFS
jgi:hypothetical protein